MMDEDRSTGVVRTPEDVLGPLEAAIMRSLWSRREATVGDVHLQLAASASRSLAYTTVMTVLGRLHDKGLVARRQDGRRHIYSPVMNEEGLIAHLGARAADAAIARYGTAALRQFALRLDDLDPTVREQLLELAHRSTESTDG